MITLAWPSVWVVPGAEPLADFGVSATPAPSTAGWTPVGERRRRRSDFWSNRLWRVPPSAARSSTVALPGRNGFVQPQRHGQASTSSSCASTMASLTSAGGFLVALLLCAESSLAFAPARVSKLPARGAGWRAARAPPPSMALLDDLADGFSSLVSGGGKVEAEPALPPVIINPDFKLAGIFTVLALLLDSIPYVQLILGPIVTLLAVLFAVQTTRIRFRFDDEAFELLNAGEMYAASRANPPSLFLTLT